MLPLRYTRRWQIAGLLVLIAVLVVALSPASWFMPDINVSRFHLNDKGLHGITFAFLTVWFSGQYSRRSYWRLVLGMLAFGSLIELCQDVVGRDAEWLDLLADAIGIATGLVIAMIGAGGWSLRLEHWLQVRHAEN